MSNNTQVLVSIISIFLTACLTFIVSHLTNMRQRELEFEYDHRQYLVDKRKAAYDDIGKFFEWLNAEDKIKFLTVHVSAADFKSMNISKEASSRIAILKGQTLWWGEQMNGAISELQGTLDSYSIELVDANNLSEGGDRKKMDTLFALTKRISVARSKIIQVYFNDIVTLDRLDDYKKNKIERVG